MCFITINQEEERKMRRRKRRRGRRRKRVGNIFQGFKMNIIHILVFNSNCFQSVQYLSSFIYLALFIYFSPNMMRYF
jgi:hypothetical protein